MARVRSTGFAITLAGAGVLGALLMLAPTGAATTMSDLAGVQLKDTVSGGPLATDFVHLETTCGSACALTGGDEVIRSLCPPTTGASAGSWTWHWSGGLSSAYNSALSCTNTNRVAAVDSNGFISFVKGATNTSNTAVCSSSQCYTSTQLPTATNPNGAIFGSWHDLYPCCGGFASGAGTMYAQTSGATPNRVMTVEFLNVAWACWVDGAETFEFKLYESDSHVDVIYGTQVPGTVDTANCPGFQNVRVGEENNLGTTGIQYFGGVGIYSPPSNIGLTYKDVVSPGILSNSFVCNTAGLNGWCRSLTNTLSIADNGDTGAGLPGVGVKTRTFSVDGGSPTSIANNTATAVTFAEGTHTITSTVTDWAGNTATTTLSAAPKIDITAPTLSIGLTCTTNANGVCVDPAHLTPTASDALSGIGSVACTLDGSAVSCSNGQDVIVSLGGHHSFVVTATDAAGNSVSSTKAFDIITDTIAPVLSLATSCTTGNAGWCLSAAAITVRATDDSGSVSSLACALDGVAVSCPNGGVVNVAADGLHTLTATATDAAGNVGTGSTSLQIDTTAPSLDLGAGCALAGANGWCRGAEGFAPSAADATSGVDSISCTLDGAAAPCSTSVSLDGAHTFVASATDAAGNSATSSLAFSIDASAPILSLTNACASPGVAGWCLGGLTFSQASFDQTSGLASVQCTLDGAATDCSALSPIADGSHTASATATDLAGNTASASLTRGLDGTAPIAGITSSCALPGDNGWCRGAIGFAVDPVDATSGVDNYRCTIDGTATDCGALSAITDGTHVGSLVVTDVAGNSASASLAKSIDATAPVLSLTQSCASPGASGWCLGAVSIASSATDATSGLASATCTIDGAAAACDALDLANDGTHTVSISATDLAGNAASTSLSAALDQTPPTLSLAPACDLAGNAGWCRAASFDITTSGADATSGLASLACTVDGNAADCAAPVSGEGAHSISALATDVAGNTATQQFSLSIDSVAPSVGVTPACSLAGNAGWCRGDLSASAAASDATSGLGALACAIDGTATDCGALAISADGAHTFSAHASDAAGNVADATAAVQRDATPPTVSAAPACSLPGNAGWCRAASFDITTSAADATSGLASLACTVDGNAADCGAPVSGEGAHSISALATDVAGNTATQQFDLSIDSIAPTLAITPSCSLAGDAGWCRGSLTASLTFSDATSGVKSFFCSADDVPSRCENMVTRDVDGTHTFVADATDMAGNAAHASIVAERDATPPATSLSLSCAAPGNAGFCLAPSFGFTASGSDLTSGVGFVTCTLDGAAAPCAGSASGDGLHTVAVTVTDAAGNTATQSASLTNDAQGIAVTITPSCTNAGVAPWCRAASLGYEMSASAPTSGVASIACKLDGAAVPCSGSATGEGMHAFLVSAVANSGATASRSLDVGIDSVAPAPVVTIGCATPGTVGFCLAPTMSFAASATDATSGLASVTCAADDAASDCSGALAGEGAHGVVVTATDAAGNVATAGGALTIDSVAPVVGLAPACDITGADGWCRGTTSATASATDATSGVGSTACALDGATVACDALSTAAQGDHTMSIVARDVAGNTASASVASRVDSVIPTTSSTLAGATGLHGWFVGPVTATLACADAAPGSGCAHDEIAVDGADLATGASALVPADGAHTVSFRSVDAAGNVGQTGSTSFQIDQTPPVVTVALAGTAGAQDWFRGQVTATLSCSDATSGTTATSIAYTLDGAAPQTYVAPILVTKEGASALHVTCIDVAGNAISKDATIKIDSVAPSGTVNAPMLAASGVDVMWTANDATSGLDLVQIQVLTNLGAPVIGQAYETVCTDKVGGATSAEGACHIDSATASASDQCYRIVVIDNAGNVKIGPTLDLANLNNAVSALGSACTAKLSTGLSAALPTAGASAPTASSSKKHA